MKRLAVAGTLAILASCKGQPAEIALDEPVRVEAAQFVDGVLPGTAPGAGGPADLKITAVTADSRVALPGQAGKKLEGRASSRASAVGIRFADLGTGYWIFPLGAPDPQFPGELSWEASLDFAQRAAQVAPGFHPLRVVAIDPGGAAGEQAEVAMCLASIEPDNLASCDPSKTPPDAVISLFWDAPMDLDLRVGFPGGRTVDPKHPLSDPDAGAGDAGALADVPSITRDSVPACVEDGRRQEDLVFPKRQTGTYDVYVQLANACRLVATTFTVVVYEAQAGKLTERFRTSGRLTAAQLAGNESEQPPLYVTSWAL